MRLTADQQEHYARHLLLDGFDQEKVLASGVRVRGTDSAALWCARYLAANGIGRLQVDEPAWHDELRALGPWLELAGPTDHEIAPQGGPTEGARAATDVLRQVLQK